MPGTHRPPTSIVTPITAAVALGLLVLLTACDRSKNKPPPSAAPPSGASPTISPPAGARPAQVSTPDRYRALWASWPADWTTKAGFLLQDSAVPRMDPSPEARAGGAGTWNDLSQSLKAHEKEIAELVLIAAEKSCDFKLRPVDLDSEFMRIGGKLRIAYRVLRADAARFWQAGDMDGCVDRLAAMLGLVDHARQQKLVMTSLAGAAIGIAACDAVRVFAEQSPAGAFKPAHAAKLLAALARVDAQDPAGIDAAIKAEGSVDPTIAANIGGVKEKCRAAWQATRELLSTRGR